MAKRNINEILDNPEIFQAHLHGAELRDALREVRDVAGALAERHRWHPEMGGCVCEAHRAYDALLKKWGEDG